LSVDQMGTSKSPSMQQHMLSAGKIKAVKIYGILQYD
jgi:hypothetical protein